MSENPMGIAFWAIEKKDVNSRLEKIMRRKFIENRPIFDNLTKL
jgi:hypothetical protein